MVVLVLGWWFVAERSCFEILLCGVGVYMHAKVLAFLLELDWAELTHDGPLVVIKIALERLHLALVHQPELCTPRKHDTTRARGGERDLQ